MNTLPEVLAVMRGETAVTIELRVDPELAFFAGHFPGKPILPGVVQVDWALRLAQAEGLQAGEFQGIDLLKFNALIRPGDRLRLVLERDARDGFSFAYWRGDERCSSGRVRGGTAR